MTNEKIKIEDNFLDLAEFNKIQELMMGPSFPWFYSDKVVDYYTEDGKFQFVHVFYADNMPQSQFMSELNPILKLIPLASIWRIKANLLTRTPNIVENEFHSDIGGIPEEKIKQWTTSIFYVNTNNGWTEF